MPWSYSDFGVGCICHANGQIIFFFFFFISSKVLELKLCFQFKIVGLISESLRKLKVLQSIELLSKELVLNTYPFGFTYLLGEGRVRLLPIWCVYVFCFAFRVCLHLFLVFLVVLVIWGLSCILVLWALFLEGLHTLLILFDH